MILVFISRSATTQVMVTIADKNDNTPYFEKLLYEKEVDEQPADSSKSILTVKARDIDDGKLWKRRGFLLLVQRRRFLFTL